MGQWDSRPRRRRTPARALAVLCALVAAAVPSAPAAAADWHVSDLQLPNVNVYGISCPAASLCVAVGDPATFLVSTAPSRGAGSWAVSSRPAETLVDGQLRAVDCPTVNFCAAVEYDGEILTTTAPTLGAQAWTRTQIPGATRLTGISCAGRNYCVAVGETGEILTSILPAEHPGSWQLGYLEGAKPLADSCVSNSLCVAIGHSIYASADPTSGSAAWTELGTAPAAGTPEAISCPATSFCAAGDAGGVLVSPSPGGSAASWTRVPLATGYQVAGIDCLSAGRCVATTTSGEVFGTTAPTSPAGWFPGTFSVPTGLGLRAVSCPTEGLCVAGGRSGRIAFSTNPFVPPAAPPPPDTSGGQPPRTVLFGRPIRHLRLKPGRTVAGIRFLFTANGSYTGFACKLDRGAWQRCRPPQRYSLLRGWHVFKVRAHGPGGTDKTPAKARVKVG